MTTQPFTTRPPLRTAVVTGAGRGIGRGIAVRLAAEGLRVVVNDLDADAARAVAAEIGGFAVPGDAASEHGAKRLVDESRRHLGDIDLFVANAGIDVAGGLDATEDDWARSWDVNLMAHVRAARLLVPDWLERGHGRLLVTASAAGLLTMLGSAPYAVTKHGAVAFAEWLSATYGHRGIVVQVLCPQGVRTRMLDSAGPVGDLLLRDAAIDVEDVSASVWAALQDDRLLILPHPEVADYYAARAATPDAWLGAMRRLQRRLDDAAG
jgi:NAD(P)-dependent dehydrogenase (short-subunit alcohol dehydrogenase family)